MCELRGDLDTSVAAGRQWSLSLQCLWSLPQDERQQQTSTKVQLLLQQITDIKEVGGRQLRQLRDLHHHPLEEEQGGISGV